MTLWVSLLVAISLSCVAFVQWRSVSTDQWWKALVQLNYEQEQKLALETQHQRYLLLKRNQAYIEKKEVSESPSEGMQESAQDSQDEDQDIPPAPQKQGTESDKLQEKGVIPLNARLPFSSSLYEDPITGAIYKTAFWRLLESHYSQEKKLAHWLVEVDQEAFLKEIFQQIETLASKMMAIGTSGLDCIRFREPADQEAWYLMLKGSDRLSHQYPSLKGLIWPVTLGPGNCAVKLNLVHADFLAIQALLGQSFANRWQEMVQDKLRQYGAYEMGQQTDRWCLPDKEYRGIFEAVVKELGVTPHELGAFVDLTNDTGSALELLVRTKEGLIEVVPPDRLKKKAS